MQRGMFAVVKPAGITSAGVINKIKTVLRKGVQKSGANVAGKQGSPRIKVGHGGTLDKRATGVFVIGLGEDCKKLDTFLRSDKCYECVGELGKATDSYDMDGTVVQEASWNHVAPSDMTDALASHFCGEISQTPPTFSALKYRGKRSSDLARKGIIITHQPRLVTVYSITLTYCQLPLFKLAVHCSSGTYIRSIVHDLGQRLGSAAHVRELCRTRQGPLSLDSALSEKDWTFENIQRSIEKFDIMGIGIM